MLDAPSTCPHPNLITSPKRRPKLHKVSYIAFTYTRKHSITDIESAQLFVYLFLMINILKSMCMCASVCWFVHKISGALKPKGTGFAGVGVTDIY